MTSCRLQELGMNLKDIFHSSIEKAVYTTNKRQDHSMCSLYETGFGACFAGRYDFLRLCIGH